MTMLKTTILITNITCNNNSFTQYANRQQKQEGSKPRRAMSEMRREENLENKMIDCDMDIEVIMMLSL